MSIFLITEKVTSNVLSVYILFLNITNHAYATIFVFEKILHPVAPLLKTAHGREPHDSPQHPPLFSVLFRFFSG